MKKIILAFDGIRFSEGAFEFARKLNELKPILLTGIFLPQAELANLWSYAEGVGVTFLPQLEKDDSEQVQKNIEHFEKLCQDNGMKYRVHKAFFDLALPQLKKESGFADVLILGSEVFYKNMGTHSPNEYLRDALHNVACPVLLVPEKFNFPQNIILAYDGSEEAVYAIKQFAYLFPELTNTKQTQLVFANTHAEEDFPDKIQIEELATGHFSNLTFLNLRINNKKEFSDWVLNNKAAILVSGAYGRSGLSQLFKTSFIQDIVAGHLLPVFIAHK